MQLERDNAQPSAKNEIKISNKPNNFKSTLNYAINLFSEENEEFIVLKATGQSMLKTVKLAEILKRKISGLHQINEVTRFQDEKVYIPLEEGLDEVTLVKDITMLEITLSKNVTEE